LVTVAVVGGADAAGHRNFVSATGGVNTIWDPIADAILTVLEHESTAGYGGSLGFGTRLGHESHFVLHGCYAYDQLRFDDEKSGTDTASLHQVRANIRYYIGSVSEGPAVYVGLGPAVMFSEDDVGFNANLSLGGDFPVSDGWSILADGTLDLAVAYGHVGLAYWFD
jgi:hypothetical protein